MKVFAVGGTGYIGSSAVRALLAEGHTVTGLVRSDDGTRTLEDTGASVVRGDLSEPDFTAQLGDYDGVLYAAAGQGEAWDEVDAAATSALLDALSGSGKPLVRMSGSMVYGDTGDAPMSESDPYNPPDFLRGTAEQNKRVLDAGGLRGSVVHASLVYGRAGGDVPNTLLRAARQEGAGVYVGGGMNRWDTIHVDDLGKLLALTLSRSAATGKFVAAGPPLTLQQTARDVAQALGFDHTESVSGDKAQALFSFFAQPLTMNQHFHNDRAADLGWTPSSASLMRALGEY